MAKEGLLVCEAVSCPSKVPQWVGVCLSSEHLTSLLIFITHLRVEEPKTPSSPVCFLISSMNVPTGQFYFEMLCRAHTSMYIFKSHLNRVAFIGKDFKTHCIEIFNH